MGRPTPRVSANALEHNEAVELADVPTASEAWARAAGSRAPIRARIGARDDSSFIDGIVTKLTSFGLQPSDAEHAAAAALTAPSAALYSAADGRVLQAVLVRIGGDLIRVSLQGRLRSAGVETTLEDLTVDATPFDLTELGERARLAAELAGDCVAFPAPVSTSPKRCAVVLLGDPVKMGARENGYRWSDLVNALGRVLTVDLRSYVTHKSVRDAFPDSTRVCIAFDPAFIGIAKQVERVPTPVLVECTDLTLLDVATKVTEHILEALDTLRQDEPARRRTLKPGERVYRRKEGDSGGGFDHFGPPCEPCSHPSSQLIHPRSAPQASKGMARLYANYDESMLRKCNANSCHIYAVFAPDSL